MHPVRPRDPGGPIGCSCSPAITLSDQPECGLEAHTHTEECYTQQIGPAPLVCTLEEHAHNDDCYDAEGNLLCQMQEHTIRKAAMGSR